MLLQLYCCILLPLAQSAPINRPIDELYHGQNHPNEPKLLLNEVALNYAQQSFIELYAPNGLGGNLFTGRYFGLIIIKPNRNKSKNYIKAIVHLKELRNSRPASSTHSSTTKKYVVIGTPPADSLQGSQGQYVSVPLTADASKVKIFGETNQWLNLANDEISMIILTSSDSGSILSKLKWNPAQQVSWVFLEDQEELADYVVANQMDSMIIRGYSGPQKKCSIFNDYVFTIHKENGRLQPFLTVNYSPDLGKPKPKPTTGTTSTTGSTGTSGTTGATGNTGTTGTTTPERPPAKKSISRCGITDEPYSHKSFKYTSLTPGRSNAEECAGPQFILQDLLNSVRKGQPTSTSFGGACSIDEDDFDKVTGDQFDVREVSKAITATSVATANPTCPARDKVNHDMAKTSNAIHKTNVKRIKLMETLTDSCPDSNHPKDMLPFQRERKMHTAWAINFIFENLPHKFSNLRNIQIYAEEWFQFLVNYDNPEDSKFNCFFCSKYSDDYMIRNNSPLKNKDGIMGGKERNHVLLRDHGKSAAHKDVMEKYYINYQRRMGKILQTDLARIEPAEYEVTNNHFRTVFWLAKQGNAFTGFPSLIEMQERHKGKMGQFCRSESSATRMANSISVVYHEDLKASLLLANSGLSLIVDGEFVTFQHICFSQSHNQINFTLLHRFI